MKRALGQLWQRWTHVHRYGKWQRAQGVRYLRRREVTDDLQVRWCLDCNHCKIKKVRW